MGGGGGEGDGKIERVVGFECECVGVVVLVDELLGCVELVVGDELFGCGFFFDL